MNRQPTELPCTSKFSPVIPDLQSGRVSAGARFKNRRNSVSASQFSSHWSTLAGCYHVCPLPFFPQNPCPAPCAFPEHGLCSQHFCGIFFLARQVPWDFCLSETHPADSSWKVFCFITSWNTNRNFIPNKCLHL